MLVIDEIGIKNRNNKIGKTIDFVTKPFLWLGMNSLAIYVVSHVVPIILEMIHIGDRHMMKVLHDVLFASWMGNGAASSVSFGLFISFLCALMAYVMFKKEIFIKL
jgi:predicted acyltransferase